MMFDSSQPPSRPHQTFRDTRQDGSIHPPKVSDNSRGRHGRSALWFARTRRGGGSILHHRHIRPVLIRDWSPKMDGITATIWASQTTNSTWPLRQPRTWRWDRSCEMSPKTSGACFRRTSRLSGTNGVADEPPVADSPSIRRTFSATYWIVSSSAPIGRSVVLSRSARCRSQSCCS